MSDLISMRDRVKRFASRPQLREGERRDQHAEHAKADAGSDRRLLRR
jgi:hypothetical protein